MAPSYILTRAERRISKDRFRQMQERVSFYQEKSGGKAPNVEDGAKLLKFAQMVIADMADRGFLNVKTESQVASDNRFEKDRASRVQFVHVCLMEAAKIFVSTGYKQGFIEAMMIASGRNLEGVSTDIYISQCDRQGKEDRISVVKGPYQTSLIAFHPVEGGDSYHAAFALAERKILMGLIRCEASRQDSSKIREIDESIAYKLSRFSMAMELGKGMTPNKRGAMVLARLARRLVPKDHKHATYLRGDIDNLLCPGKKKKPSSPAPAVKAAQTKQPSLPRQVAADADDIVSPKLGFPVLPDTSMPVPNPHATPATLASDTTVSTAIMAQVPLTPLNQRLSHLITAQAVAAR